MFGAGRWLFRESDSSSQGWPPGRGQPRGRRLDGQDVWVVSVVSGWRLDSAAQSATDWGVRPGLLSGGSLLGRRTQYNTKVGLLKKCQILNLNCGVTVIKPAMSLPVTLRPTLRLGKYLQSLWRPQYSVCLHSLNEGVVLDPRCP